MVNSLEEYKEVMHCYYNVLDNIDKINEYALELERVFKKIDDISESDIYMADELFNKLSDELKIMFLRSHGRVLQFDYPERYEKDLEMIKKYDQRRAERILKK
jgi:NDP-sugar pyrophosphorylase family protein